MTSANDRIVLEHAAHAMAESIDRALKRHKEKFGGPDIVFALLTFTTGEEGFASWVSNGERESVIAGLEEMLVKLKKRSDLH